MADDKIKIGRREVLKTDFITAVNQANSPKEVCTIIGWNSTVGTTISGIKKAIKELNIDTPQFRKYSMTEKAKKGRQMNSKVFVLNKNNEKYYNAFQNFIDDKSWRAYKATIGNFLEGLGDKDFAYATVEEMLEYTGDSINKINHLKSIIDFIVSNNINNYNSKVNKDVLIWKIGKQMKYKPLVFPDELPDNSVEYIEGKKKHVLINIYERNPEARKACINHFGAICCICGFESAIKYGIEKEGMIHVHHLKMISENDNEYVIDPINDLRPVCPNCHMILHSKENGCYKIEEVMSMLKN